MEVSGGGVGSIPPPLFAPPPCSYMHGWHPETIGWHGNQLLPWDKPLRQLFLLQAWHGWTPQRSCGAVHEWFLWSGV